VIRVSPHRNLVESSTLSETLRLEWEPIPNSVLIGICTSMVKQSRYKPGVAQRVPGS